MTVLAKHIPKDNGAGFAFEIRNLQLLHALDHFRITPARLAQPREIAFHVGHKYRYIARAEVFSQCLQRHRLTRTGSARDQTVPV